MEESREINVLEENNPIPAQHDNRIENFGIDRDINDLLEVQFHELNNEHVPVSVQNNASVPELIVLDDDEEDMKVEGIKAGLSSATYPETEQLRLKEHIHYQVLANSSTNNMSALTSDPRTRFVCPYSSPAVECSGETVLQHHHRMPPFPVENFFRNMSQLEQREYNARCYAMQPANENRKIVRIPCPQQNMVQISNPATSLSNLQGYVTNYFPGELLNSSRDVQMHQLENTPGLVDGTYPVQMENAISGNSFPVSMPFGIPGNNLPVQMQAQISKRNRMAQIQENNFPAPGEIHNSPNRLFLLTNNEESHNSNFQNSATVGKHQKENHPIEVYVNNFNDCRKTSVTPVIPVLLPQQLPSNHQYANLSNPTENINANNRGINLSLLSQALQSNHNANKFPNRMRNHPEEMTTNISPNYARDVFERGQNPVQAFQDSLSRTTPKTRGRKPIRGSISNRNNHLHYSPHEQMTNIPVDLSATCNDREINDSIRRKFFHHSSGGLIGANPDFHAIHAPAASFADSLHASAQTAPICPYACLNKHIPSTVNKRIRSQKSGLTETNDTAIPSELLSNQAVESDNNTAGIPNSRPRQSFRNARENSTSPHIRENHLNSTAVSDDSSVFYSGIAVQNPQIEEADPSRRSTPSNAAVPLVNQHEDNNKLSPFETFRNDCKKNIGSVVASTERTNGIILKQNTKNSTKNAAKLILPLEEAFEAYDEQRFEKFFRIIQENKFPFEQHEELRDKWERAQYLDHHKKTGLPMTSCQRHRIRTANPPPPNISEVFEVITVE